MAVEADRWMVRRQSLPLIGGSTASAVRPRTCESNVMAKQRSYISRPYAPAWGILIGTVIGVPIGLATGSGTVTGVLGMLGLIIGTVIYYEGKSSSKDGDQSRDDSRESRLRELDRLRSKSMISDEEYQSKRKEILSDL